MPDRADLDRLAKTDEGDDMQPKAKSVFDDRRNKVIEICNSLGKPSAEYSPSGTMHLIEEYIKAWNRIIYSEITNIVYEMPSEEQGTFNSNLEKLMSYVLNEDPNPNEEIQDTVIRLWDHVHLAMKQVGNAKEILEKSTTEVKRGLHDKLYHELRDELYNELYTEFKGMEKEYITILGIFSSVVLSFVAGITFSTSVLENMHNVGIYRLVLVILLIAFVLLNTVNLLVRYIFRLNRAEDCKFPMRQLNEILGILLLSLLVSWVLNVDQIPEFVGAFLPWSK